MDVVKVKKYVLFFDMEIDFEFIGICMYYSDYCLVWGINQEFGVLLIKCDDQFVIISKKG